MIDEKFCGWSYIDVRSPEVEKLRDYLTRNINSITNYYEEESDLHLTIHPGFKITEESSLKEINYTSKEYRSKIKRFYVTGLKCHPSRENPRVIYMESDVNVDNIRSKISSVVREDDQGQIIREPTTPHITLLKVGGNNDIRKYKEEILTVIDEAEREFNTYCEVKANTLTVSKME